MRQKLNSTKKKKTKKIVNGGEWGLLMQWQRFAGVAAPSLSSKFVCKVREGRRLFKHKKIAFKMEFVPKSQVLIER